jgi:hypothetical protein
VNNSDAVDALFSIENDLLTALDIPKHVWEPSLSEILEMTCYRLRRLSRIEDIINEPEPHD